MNFERNGYLVMGYDIALRHPDDFKVTITNSLNVPGDRGHSRRWSALRDLDGQRRGGPLH